MIIHYSLCTQTDSFIVYIEDALFGPILFSESRSLLLHATSLRDYALSSLFALFSWLFSSCRSSLYAALSYRPDDCALRLHVHSIPPHYQLSKSCIYMG